MCKDTWNSRKGREDSEIAITYVCVHVNVCQCQFLGLGSFQKNKIKEQQEEFTAKMATVPLFFVL